MAGKLVRIGGASGFWGDSSLGALQLARSGKVDYLVFDYLAEVTMSLLVRAREKDPAQGYATDFVGVVKMLLADITSRGVRIVANAGGVNPRACAAALHEIAVAAGSKLEIAIVEGDDVSGLADTLRSEGMTEMFSGAAFPERILSANAYLGATPIAAALGRGADIVVTGRVADSALALGMLMHEFGWRADDWDRLASGSLVGHILECGAQATGGLHTDWEAVPDWANIGYPIAECAVDGSFVIAKPDGTGGLITPGVIAEQMLYEVGDPTRYVLPDVTADFSEVRIEEAGPNRVRVAGALGRPAPAAYKVSATHVDGWRAYGTLSVIGIDADRKARRTAEAILERTRAIFRHRNLADYRRTDIEILGAEAVYGPHSRAAGAREVVMKLGVEHDDPAALGIFAREIAPAATSFAPGTTGFAGGRPKPTPIVRLFSFLLDKDRLPPPVVAIGTEHFEVPVAIAMSGAKTAERPVPAVEPHDGETVLVPLIRLAFARSGDKGDSANIGVIPRDPAFTAVLRRELTAERVRDYFAHLVEGPVHRYEVPGVGGFNFLLERALAGGGMASLRNDPLGKGFAQMLLDMPVAVPADLARGIANQPADRP
ncbi:acyclic terpene utilization AtuA family protein [Mesorhizobium sp. L-8-3]|uniref:acyclic terpene utilization AtuA family protein n=1 Tax=Mesorhizobium sp. L-8-3 TaxID=2744522 RepID=UPI00192731A9|nr:acyclic terpene utilization AtuA family protein [Mesorhizobium sp. L-8-3]BCH23836.1 hypothetical protein MesoLjLb_36210 [Mesorhizobium sp. L-8-3]